MDRPGVVDRDHDERQEPVDAPDAGSFPVAEPAADGERGYGPIAPRSGLRELIRKLTAPFVGLGLLILKFGGLLLKLKVVTTAGSMLVSIAAYAWIWGLPFAVGFVVLLLMVGLAVVRPNPILVLIIVIGGLDLWRRWQARGEAAEYYRLSIEQRVTVGVVYLGLVIALAVAVSATHVERTF